MNGGLLPRLARCLFGLAALAVVASAAIAAKPASVAERILVFGDSLAAAYNIDPKDGWVSLLAEKMRPAGVVIVNASLSGETTAGGRSRIQADLKRHHPTIVLLELGANDALRGLALKDTKANLEAIVAACRGTGARVILVGMQIPPNYGLDYAAQFRNLYPEMAARQKLGLVPFLLEGIADKLENFQADRLHPIAAVQPRIVENVLPEIRKAMTRSNLHR
ncbi:MAG: arylesterase [Betaproteobacteria bacterium]|nr:arylesterase [Betaproteobacteria bacterium]